LIRDYASIGYLLRVPDFFFSENIQKIYKPNPLLKIYCITFDVGQIIIQWNSKGFASVLNVARNPRIIFSNSKHAQFSTLIPQLLFIE